MIKYILAVLFIFTTIKGFTQTNTDTSKIAQVSPIKGLTFEQYQAYATGVDMNNLALVAQLNNYPDPQKALDMKKELALTPAQIASINTINVELHRKIKEMGQFIIKNEKMLDGLFSSKKLDDGTLIFYTNRYGLYQGEMRNAILQAYVKVRSILNEGQCGRYELLQKAQH